MIAGEYFITPHAVRRFIELIAPGLDYEHALAAIIRGLRDHAGEPKPTRSGAVYIRVRGEHRFRAIIGPGEGGRLAVVTVCRSGHKKGGRR